MSFSTTVSKLGKHNDRPVVIAGAGVIGCSTAYYLAKEFGVSSILVDPTGNIAPAASGKAGGFLALDWNDYSPVGPLARRSFDLHQELADVLGASNIDYRRLTCAAIAAKSASLAPKRPSGKKLQGIEWAVGDAVQGIQSLGGEDSIAQVHPKKLCEALWDATCQLAPTSKIIRGSVLGPVYKDNVNDDENDEKEFLGAKVSLISDGKNNPTQDDNTLLTVDGKALLFACGPWTANVMTGVKYHSVVMKTSKTLSQCVFFSGFGDPEVYVRPDQTAYCTGFPDNPVHVTEAPGEEQVRDDAVQRIETAVKQAADLEAVSGSTNVNQACYLPSTPDGLPIMGELNDNENKKPKCYIATGHSCWGILMGPASGEAMAHLIETGSSPRVPLGAFDPSRIRDLHLVPRAKEFGKKGAQQSP